jgi:hypothetical protein
MKVFWEWIFPTIIVIGVALTAYDVYPLNKWFFLFGNGGLTVMCIIWKRWSLVALNSILTMLYLTGLILK